MKQEMKIEKTRRTVKPTNLNKEKQKHLEINRKERIPLVDKYCTAEIRVV